MDQVIEFPGGNEKSGYHTERNGSEIVGVYVGELAAAIEDGGSVVTVAIGEPETKEYTTMTKKELNDFCIMWLSLFDPTAIKYDDE